MARARKQIGVSEPRIEVVLVDTKHFYTVDMGHEAWRDGVVTIPEKSFVRIHPPEMASDADVERVRKMVDAHKPVAVHVRPRARAQVVTEQAKANKYENRGAREILLALVEEANTQNRPALNEEVSMTMAKVGL